MQVALIEDGPERHSLYTHQSVMSINELTLVTAKVSGNGSSLEETRAATSVSSFLFA